MNRLKQKLDDGFVRAALSLALACLASSAGAQLVGTTAHQESSGSLKILGYYDGVQNQTINFNTNASGTCTTGSVSFACGQNGTIAAKGSGGAGMMKIIYQPFERFQYYALYGVGDYSMSVPSTTVANVLTGDSHGQIYGGGIRASIVPDTIVTPGIALDLSMTQAVYNFNRSYPGASPAGPDIDQRLTLMTYQFSVEASHRFTLDEDWKLEPYGGMKWVRVQADLKDLGDGSHSGGQTDTLTPFLGLRIPVEGHEAFFAEASFLDGYHYGGGMELRFK